jgi:hypothetical protein
MVRLVNEFFFNPQNRVTNLTGLENDVPKTQLFCAWNSAVPYGSRGLKGWALIMEPNDEWNPVI